MKLANNRAELPCTELSIVKALKSINKQTWDHCIRVEEASLLLAKEIKLSQKDKKILSQAALLHDIGKLLIPINILNKPGALNDDEWYFMRKHSELGEFIIKDDKNTYSEMNNAANIIRFHHEHYNGLGYPDGLKGDGIPLLSRIIAVTDVFDALTTTRPYRKAFNVKDSMELMKEMKGKELDPQLTEIFFNKVLPNLNLGEE